MGIAEAILLTVFVAATPLIIAALGELVVERSGVLNLGVEGMMVMGAATGFVAAIVTGSTVIGLIAAILAGMALACVFAFLTLGLAANQVATGLALTILGLGISGLIGADYIGARREPMAKVWLPVLTDLPVVGRVLFGQDPIVYFALLLAVGGLVLPVPHPRRADRPRGRREPRLGARARLSGAEDPLLLRAVRRRLRRSRGAYLSLAMTPFWSPGMTAGRGWIALAIVVFASWLPFRAVIGAWLFGGVTILQLHAQARGWRCPRRRSRLPYIATVVVLVILSRARPAAIRPPRASARRSFRTGEASGRAFERRHVRPPDQRDIVDDLLHRPVPPADREQARDLVLGEPQPRHPRGIADHDRVGGNVAADHRARADDGAGADRHAGHDHRLAADPDIVADHVSPRGGSPSAPCASPGTKPIVPNGKVERPVMGGWRRS